MEPVGPLPPSVYWRRRGLALAVVVLLLALVVCAVAAVAGGSEGPATSQASAPEPSPTPRAAALASPAPGGPSAGPMSAAGPTSAAAPTSGAPAAGPASGPSAASAPSVATPTVPLGAPGPDAALSTPPGGDGLRGLLTARPRAPIPSSTASSTTPPAPTRSPPAPSRCADDGIRVTARTDKTRYPAGEKPLLSLVVTNIGREPCVRDLDAARQAVAVVRTPGDGLWGSNDCSPGNTDDVRTLAPGAEAVFAVRWSGRTSKPGCTGQRTEVPAGNYQLLARLDGIVSQPIAFALS